LAAFIVFMMVGNTGFIKYYELHSEQDELRREIIQLNMQLDSLRHEIELLKSDLPHIEKVAREKYNMKKEGEVVYQIVPDKKKP
jgi:cell division protein FtsB